MCWGALLRASEMPWTLAGKTEHTYGVELWPGEMSRWIAIPVRSCRLTKFVGSGCSRTACSSSVQLEGDPRRLHMHVVGCNGTYIVKFCQAVRALSVLTSSVRGVGSFIIGSNLDQSWERRGRRPGQRRRSDIRITRFAMR